MKKIYEKPEVEIVLATQQNVILAGSTLPDEPGDPNEGWDEE